MENSVRWIHLSDWHCPGKEDPFVKLVFDKLIDDIDVICNQHAISGKNFEPDFIVHTGDVSFSGKPSEYNYAIKVFERIFNVIPNLNKQSIFIIPGNHDVFDDGYAHKASE